MMKRIAILSFWIFLALAGVVLFYFGAKAKGEKVCKGVNIEVTENAKQVFTDEEGIKIEIAENGGKSGIPLNSINLMSIEKELKKDVWIKEAKIYFDNNQILQIAIKENEPIARIFALNGNSFYIDSAMNYLPANRNLLAQVPVFTGFPTDKEKLSSPDSALLAQVKTIAQFILADSNWMSFTSQINIAPDTVFQIIPIVGNSVITIGNADNLPDKFNRLYSFYKQVLNKTGINKFQNIDVQYKGQVVASAFSAKDSTAMSKPVAKDSTKQIVDTSAGNNSGKPLPKATTVSPNQSKSVGQATQLHNSQKKIILTTKNHNANERRT